MSKFVCVECGHLFIEPVWWMETHGLDGPPYEKHYGSPCCRSNYVKAKRCDCCGDYITTTYIVTEDNKLYCQDCHSVRDLEDDLE